MMNISFKKMANKVTALTIFLTLLLSVYYLLPFGVSLRITVFTYPLAIAALTLLLFKGIRRSSHPANLGVLLKLLTFFVTSLMVSTLISHDIFINHGPISFLFIFVFSLLLATLTISVNLEHFFLVTYLVVSVSVSILISYNYLFVEHYYWARTTIKINDVLRDPNYVGAYIAAAPTILYMLFISTRAKATWRVGFLSFIIIMIFLFAAIALGSRSVLVSMVAPLIMLYMYSQYKKKTFKPLLIAPIIILCLTLIPILMPDSRFFEKKASDLADLGVRSEIWSAAIERILQQPLLGYGLSVDITEHTFGYATHNLYIDIALFGGFVAVLLFLTYILGIIILLPRQQILMSILLMPLFLPIASINGFMTFAFWLPIMMSLILYSYLFKLKKITNLNIQ